MSLYSRLDRLAADVAKLDRKVDSVSNAPQAQRTSIEAGTMDVNDEDGNLISTIGLQEDGSGATRFFDGPTPPIPAGFTALADGPLIQGTWDGSFVDGRQATYDLAYLEVAATFVDDDSRVSFATITAKEGASASVVANQSGLWAVAVRSVSQAGKKSEFASAGTVEVKLVDLAGAIEAVQDSANGKNKVTYSSHAPTENDPGIFDDTWFVGQVGRPNDVVEATNLAMNPSFNADRRQYGGYPDAPLPSNGGATLTVESSWASTGSKSLKIQPTGSNESGAWMMTNGSSTSLYPGETGNDGGRTFTVAATLRLSAPINGTGTLTREISISYYTKTGARVWTFARSPQAPNTAGVHRVSVTFTLPANVLRWDARVMNGSAADPIWIDDFSIIPAANAPTYFDGDTEDGATDNESHYRWTGTPHASTSEKYLPALDIGDSDNWNVIEQYRHDGTGWVKVELSHYVFSTVDLGKATVGELDGIRIMARTITGDLFSGDAFDGLVFRGNTFDTRDGNGEFSDRGLFFQKPDGTAIFRVPTDGTPISMSAADVQIQRAQVDELELVDGEVRSGGVMTLASGVTAPASPAELNASWKRETQLPRPEESSMDWTGVAVWNGLYVRGVNVLGSAGDSADRIEVYNPDGTLNKSISIDLNPRAGVAVIGDIVYTIGPDHVARPGAEKQWCHGFNLNTGARVSRWEYVHFWASNQKKIAIGADGTNLMMAGVDPNAVLYVFKYTPSTGALVGSQMTTNFDVGYAADIHGVGTSGGNIYVSPRGQVREYTVNGSTLTKTAGFSWDNPNWNSGGFVFVDGRPIVVDTGAVYTGSTFSADISLQVCYTWWNGSQETTPSPVADVALKARESVTVSMAKRAGLQKRIYVRTGTSGNWYRQVVGTDVTSLLISDLGAGGGWGSLYPLPTTNTFPASTPAVLKSAGGNFEARGDGSGRWGPLTFGADGSMTGIPRMAAGKGETVTVTSGGFNTKTVSFPAGRFTSPPAVTVSADSTSAELVNVNPLNITKDGFTLSVRRTNNTPTTVDWIAMEVS